MISIVIPAHNEGSVIARTLSMLLNDKRADAFDIIVVCNGCTDNTADMARQFGPAVAVVETDIAGKTHALNLGDRVARGFPRIYADADVLIDPDSILALADCLARDEVSAAAPLPDFEMTKCTWPVRRYYDIRCRLPSSREGIGGSGVYALSEAGRRRFAHFPDIIADDTYVRLQFRPHERKTLASVRSLVFPPHNIGQLVRVRTRAQAGTAELLTQFPALRANRTDANDRALVGLFASPRLWPGLTIYLYVNLLARVRAALRARKGRHSWQRDDTTRAAPPLATPR